MLSRSREGTWPLLFTFIHYNIYDSNSKSFPLGPLTAMKTFLSALEGGTSVSTGHIQSLLYHGCLIQRLSSSNDSLYRLLSSICLCGLHLIFHFIMNLGLWGWERYVCFWRWWFHFFDFLAIITNNACHFVCRVPSLRYNSKMSPQVFPLLRMSALYHVTGH